MNLLLGMIVFRKTLVCFGFLLIVFYSLQSALCDELVGILPFSNQRYQKQDDWLGYYIQARIKANLGNNSNWKFHHSSVVRLWSARVDRSLPISPLNTILIEGSFQQVVDLGHISIRVKRNKPGKDITTSFEISFSAENLDEQIDSLSKKVGLWIQPNFKLKTLADYPRMYMPGTKDIFKLRQIMFELGDPPEIRMILNLVELVDGSSPPEMICDLTEGMLILSQFLQEKEQKSLLTKTELLLRKAVLKNKKSPCLYSLLSETYYLSNNYPSWIQKTAEDAIRLDSQDELAYILRAIINDSDVDSWKKDIEQIKRVNPWLFSKSIAAGALFQKGILKKEISSLAKSPTIDR
ncbi:MAG: hypothetical protein HQ517_03335 [SAR324 cluster bacterium]|nr:hypothetical protein [SAR324 cluster bacterium]